LVGKLSVKLCPRGAYLGSVVSSHYGRIISDDKAHIWLLISQLCVDDPGVKKRIQEPQ
jgi:hypothetical protein